MGHRNHAVVLGASIGVLFAARGRGDKKKRVTLLERDRLPSGAEARKGVPQGQHPHGLLSSGFQAVEEFFPGITSSLLERGAQVGDTLGSGLWSVGGRPLGRTASGMNTINCSRPLLEAAVRSRVLALPNLQLIDHCDVLGLDGDARRVRGVRLLRRADHSSQELLNADLVVDCTGRGSRLPAWLSQLGLAAPQEERVRVDMHYLTVLLSRRPSDLGGAHVAVIGAAPPNTRCGAALGIEGGRWLVTLAGYFGDRAGNDDASLLAFAREMPAPWIYELLQRAERLSEPIAATFSHSQRRRYERLERFPRGLLALGDSICAFNPVYGQGMSVAALEARLLQRCAFDGDAWRSYFSLAGRIVDAPWTLAVGNDLRFHQLDAPRPRSARWVGAYMGRLVRAASVNPRVAVDFLKATQLVAPVTSLFRPAMMLRVLRFGADRSKVAPALSQPTGARSSA